MAQDVLVLVGHLHADVLHSARSDYGMLGEVVQPHVSLLFTAADKTFVTFILLLQRRPSWPTARPRLSWKA
jgi:hypothetical protein